MLKKLRRRIRLLIQIPMIILIILVTAAFFYLNYSGIVSSGNNAIHRFTLLNGDPNAGDKDDERSRANKREIADIENAYEIEFNDSEIKNKSTDDERLIETARSLAHGKERSGFYNGIFYCVEKRGSDTYIVKLLLDEDLNNGLRVVSITSACIFVIGVALVFVLSFTISKIIIKPVDENEKKQKTFITDTSHELKTPLAVMQANAEVLQSEIGENKWLGYINNEIEDMEGLMGSLLLLSQSEQESEKEEIREFDVSEKAALLISVYESHALERGITVDADIQPNVSFTGSEYDIENIISPLFDNALRYTHDKGHIRFSLAKQRKKLIITVQNEGEPIPPEDREKIFDRFYRVDKARSRGEKHYGLGLAIVRATAEKYRGSVSVDCADGVTTFMVKLKKR